MVVDKPRGVAAHPTPGWTGPTVIGGLLGTGHRVATSGAAERQGIVHRLDANTTGVMVVAKSEPAYSALKQAFRDRTVSKTYHALIQGHPDPLRGYHLDGTRSVDDARADESGADESGELPAAPGPPQEPTESADPARPADPTGPTGS